MGLFSGDNEIGNLLQDAVKLKSAQIGQKRKTYETWPYFVQHTIFHNEKEEFRAWRELPFDEKMIQSEKIKQEGNELYKKKNFGDAVDKYEEAMSLFHYCYSKDPGWRKNNKGIDDDLLVLVDDEGENEEMATQVKKFRTACCNNLAACKSKLTKFDEAVKACDVSIELDPTNVKALYRRAEAKHRPAGSTAYDLDCAIRDLTKATALDPNDKDVKTLLARLRVEQKDQRTKDKATFTGMFDRGEIYDALQSEMSQARDGSSGESALSKNDPDWNSYHKRIQEVSDDDPPEKRIADAELLRDLYMRNGKEDQAKELNEKIQESKRILRERQQQTQEPDWENPTEEMVEDAKKHGIDLNDPLVKAEFSRCAREGVPSDLPDEEPPSGNAELDTGELPLPKADVQADVPWWKYIVLFVVLGLILRLIDYALRKRLLTRTFKYLSHLHSETDEETPGLVAGVLNPLAALLGWGDEEL